MWVFPQQLESEIKGSMGLRPPAVVNYKLLEAGKDVLVVSRDRLPRELGKVREGDQEVVSLPRGDNRTP